MKKFLAKILLLSLVCIFTLTCFGCGGKQTAEITFWVYSTEGALVDADDYKYDEVKLNIDLYKRSAPKTVEQFKKLAKEEISEDEIKDLQDKLQKMTDQFIKDIDVAIEVKSKEIMTV